MIGPAAFSNWRTITAPDFASSSDLATAPFIPSAAGVKINSAPYALINLRRSFETDSGIDKITL